MQVTKQTPCQINPIWNSSVVLENLSLHDRVFFQVKDFGMLSESHLGGMLGPRGVASTSMKVGEAFNGFLELEPATEIPMNGSPLLQVVVRFSQVSVYGMPGLGDTDVLAGVFGSQGVGGTHGVQPSAPQAMTSPQPQPEPESAQGAEKSSQVFEMSGCQGVEGKAEVSGGQGDEGTAEVPVETEELSRSQGA